MVEWLTYGLQVEIVTIGLLIYGLAVFLRAVKRIDQEYRFAIFLVLLALIMEVIQGTMGRILLTSNIGVESPLWLVSPFVGVVGAYFLVLGARKFLSASEK